MTLLKHSPLQNRSLRWRMGWVAALLFGFVSLALAGYWLKPPEPDYRLGVAPIPVYTGVNQIEGELSPGMQFTRELVRRVEEEYGFNIEVTYIPAWEIAHTLFQENKVDILFPEIVGDSTRGGMTAALVGKAQGYAAYTLPSTIPVDNAEGLVGKKVGLISGRYYPPELMQDNRIKLVYYRDLDHSFTALMKGEIDAVLENPWIAENVRARLGLNELQHGAPFSPHYISYRFQINEAQYKAIDAFNTVISKMLVDGSYHRIFASTPEAFLINTLPSE